MTEENPLTLPRKSEVTAPPSSPWRHPLLPCTLILIGAVLRLVWPLDFEWKGDEKWSFDLAQRTVRGEHEWPWIGMPSSVGLMNPGLSVWPFVGLASVADTPVGMSLGVMCINAFWLLGLASWIRFTWEDEDRWWGYWAIAIFSVSPLPLVYSRKIWPPDVFPLFLLPWLWAHSRRNQTWFAFGWGFFGALLGQLHMSGFFAAAGLVAGSWITDRKEVKWVPWAWGSVLGVLPMFPWIWLELHRGWHPPGHGTVSLSFLAHAYTIAWGLGLDDALGADTGAFLAGPTVGGHSTWLVFALQTALLALATYGTLLAWVDRRSRPFPIQQRPLLWGALIGGGLLQIVSSSVNPYYLVAWSPVFHILAAWVYRRRPRWLAVTAVLQLTLSVAFLSYIHWHGGAPGGDYGVTYRVQTGQSQEKGE